MNIIIYMFRTILIFIGEIIIGVILVNYSLKAFLIFLLIIIFIRFEYLRKMIRVFNVSTESKIMAIARKVNVKEEEINAILEETKESVGYKEWKSLEKDYKDIYAR